ncbi:hypothetical protein [Microcoleus vaginatus]|uniref:hypothetical protein n=1 Tax=Microcoleus vaginatus TaxID=119532 RepID=UPI000301B4DE
MRVNAAAKIRSLGGGAPDIMFVELPVIRFRNPRSHQSDYAARSLGIISSF